MKPRISLITLGVDDLERALRFYRDGLGLPTEGIIGAEFDHGAVVFFELHGGLRLALFPRASLARDAGLPVDAVAGGGVRSAGSLPRRSYRGPKADAALMTLAHNVGSRAEVDAVMMQASGAGATIVKPALETFWGGYAGYFRDPDGHLWEVAWNPAWEIAD